MNRDRFDIFVASGYLCPPGWLANGDTCYYVSKRNSPTKTWHQANAICNQLQAELLSIKDQEEFVSYCIIIILKLRSCLSRQNTLLQIYIYV